MRDRHNEEEEKRALEQESEDFLKNQLIEMSQLEDKQREAGLLSEDAVPIRLALQNPATEVKEEVLPAKPKPTLTFDGDDEEDEAAKKKTRTLVKLEYGGDGLTEAERLAKRNAKLLELRSDIPRDRRQVWTIRIEWAAINEVSRSLTLLTPVCHARQNPSICPREDESSAR
jgi:RNA-binding protein 25